MFVLVLAGACAGPQPRSYRPVMVFNSSIEGIALLPAAGLAHPVIVREVVVPFTWQIVATCSWILKIHRRIMAIIWHDYALTDNFSVSAVISRFS